MRQDLDLVSQNLLDAIRQFVLATVQQQQPPRNSADNNRIDSEGFSKNLRDDADFTYQWADGPEKFEDVKSGIARWRGREYAVKIGFAERWAAGKNRVRVAILVKGYLICEFAGADTGRDCLIASMIKVGGKYLLPDAEVPPEYRSMKVRPYRGIVDGKHAKDRLAVVCEQDDYDTMIKHALIRYTTWTPSQKNDEG
jgi:hypothetical protein